MPSRDAIRLQHMLDAANEALSFATGRKRDDLNRDRMLVNALLRSIEVIGEAASRVGAETRTRYPAIPWLQVVGMRNRLIHAYFDVDLDRVWDTVSCDLPALIDELKKAVSPDLLSR